MQNLRLKIKKSILKKIMRGDFENIQDFRWFSGDDIIPGHYSLQRMENAGLVQDIDFFILYKDPEATDIEYIFMTEDAWPRLVEKYPKDYRSDY